MARDRVAGPDQIDNPVAKLDRESSRQQRAPYHRSTTLGAGCRGPRGALIGRLLTIAGRRAEPLDGARRGRKASAMRAPAIAMLAETQSMVSTPCVNALRTMSSNDVDPALWATSMPPATLLRTTAAAALGCPVRVRWLR